MMMIRGDGDHGADDDDDDGGSPVVVVVVVVVVWVGGFVVRVVRL